MMNAGPYDGLNYWGDSTYFVNAVIFRSTNTESPIFSMILDPQDFGKHTPIETGIKALVVELKNCISPYFN